MNEADRREKTMLDLFDWITDFVAGRDDVTADDIRLAIAREFADGPRERDLLLAQYRERAESAEQELKDFSELFDLQHKRSVEADKLWQHDTGEKYFPDLGELLRYLMAQRELMYRLYWMLREGGYASDEYAEIMESIERKDFCRPNDQAQAAPLAASSLERLVGQED